MPHTIKYKPSATLKKFHKDSSLVRGVMGPIGSGKTTACCFELMQRILTHPVNPKTGFRELRVLIVRRSYKELQDTTIRTWLKLFPVNIFGRFIKSDLVHQIRLKDVECDVLFRALDSPDDASKLLSMELTLIFVNEAREISFDIIQMLPRRLRYPSASYPDFFKGMIMDTNPTDVDHWWYRSFEEIKPAGWALFKQPGGLNKNAENLENLPKGYYTSQMSGASIEWLSVYRDAKYGFAVENGTQAVYPEYNDSLHVKELKPILDQPLIIGLDFGLTPAAIFCQQEKNGAFLVLAEITTFDTAAFELAELIKAKINKNFYGLTLEVYGDPAGVQRSQTDGLNIFEILSQNGLIAQPAPTNNSTWRKESLKKLLSSLKQGRPAILIDSGCHTLRKALIGGYCYKIKNHQKSVLKNKYSHPVEALEYAITGSNSSYQQYNSREFSKNNSIDHSWEIV